MTTPTAEGLRRYPDQHGYFDVGDGDPQPCTCVPTCPVRCPGACGCKACSLMFTDFCDAAGLFGADGLIVPEDEAVRRYQTGE